MHENIDSITTCINIDENFALKKWYCYSYLHFMEISAAVKILGKNIFYGLRV
jgi:hypothetical protein